MGRSSSSKCSRSNRVKPKTLLDCCKDAQEFMDEYDLNDGHDTGTLT